MIEYLLYALVALVAILLIIIRDAISIDGAKAKAALQNVGARVRVLNSRSA